MGSPTHPTTIIENLPVDVLSNILIRLLAKQLAQMRCVSKSYNTLLSRYSFVKAHLDRSFHYNDEVLLIFHNDFSFSLSPFTARLSRSPHLELENFIKCPVIPQSQDTDGIVIGSVNGLICFSSCGSPFTDSVFYIWNPSLSAVLALPQSSLKHENLFLVNKIPPRFGYDPKTDDYKVVKISAQAPLPKYLETFEYKVEVYSMRKGSWDIITQTFPSHIRRLSIENEVCVDGHDGHLHWFGDRWGGKTTIVAFDLGAHSFREIPPPDLVLNYTGQMWMVLGVLAGKLCVMAKIGDCACDMWVMEEYGVAESWVKKQILSELRSDIAPYGFTLSNEFLFETDFEFNTEANYEVEYDDVGSVVYKKRFGLYNSVVTKTKIFKIRSGPFKVVGYVDSLVWVAPMK